MINDMIFHSKKRSYTEFRCKYDYYWQLYIQTLSTYALYKTINIIKNEINSNTNNIYIKYLVSTHYTHNYYCQLYMQYNFVVIFFFSFYFFNFQLFYKFVLKTSSKMVFNFNFFNFSYFYSFISIL